jgi:hypothetical protein
VTNSTPIQQGSSTAHRERRSTVRYPLQLALHYRLLHKNRSIGEGTGTTVDISTHGVLFTPDVQDDLFDIRAHTELMIEWPKGDGQEQIHQLNLMGLILRIDERGIAVRVIRHSFLRPADSGDPHETLLDTAAGAQPESESGPFTP